MQTYFLGVFATSNKVVRRHSKVESIEEGRPSENRKRRPTNEESVFLWIDRGGLTNIHYSKITLG
jgi:hypothetical protein